MSPGPFLFSKYGYRIIESTVRQKACEYFSSPLVSMLRCHYSGRRTSHVIPMKTSLLRLQPAHPEALEGRAHTAFRPPPCHSESAREDRRIWVWGRVCPWSVAHFHPRWCQSQPAFAIASILETSPVKDILQGRVQRGRTLSGGSLRVSLRKTFLKPYWAVVGGHHQPSICSP